MTPVRSCRDSGASSCSCPRQAGRHPPERPPRPPPTITSSSDWRKLPIRQNGWSCRSARTRLVAHSGGTGYRSRGSHGRAHTRPLHITCQPPAGVKRPYATKRSRPHFWRLDRCGLASPGIVLVAGTLRADYSALHQPVSMLSLGAGGMGADHQPSWSPDCSLIACAVGLRRAFRSRCGATWGPLLIAIHGVGLVGSGQRSRPIRATGIHRARRSVQQLPSVSMGCCTKSRASWRSVR